ncbi:hypothetical protein PFISCL1PPCAC_14283, partial [Pristionchus fissidentatus]
QRQTTSQTMRMGQLYLSVLRGQTLIFSVFYVYPLLIIMITLRFQIDFLPGIVLAVVRPLLVIFYMSSTLPQFYIMMKANYSFRKVGQ